MTPLAYLPGTRAWKKRRARDICSRAAERIQEIVDGELPPSKAAKVLERHLVDCPPCLQEAEALRALKQAVARVSGEADPETVDRLRSLGRQLCDGTEEHR
ncbi:MAG: anti-sigma factor family protein [Actinomycetota bacterium]